MSAKGLDSVLSNLQGPQFFNPSHAVRGTHVLSREDLPQSRNGGEELKETQPPLKEKCRARRETGPS